MAEDTVVTRRLFLRAASGATAALALAGAARAGTRAGPSHQDRVREPADRPAGRLR